MYAIISDIHANSEALERVLRDARECEVDKIVCLGDVVGYGPEASSTLARIRSVAALSIMGNHDAAVCGKINADDFIDLAADAVKRHHDELTNDALNWLGERPLVGSIDNAQLVHGDFTYPSAFNYVDTAEVASANFAVTTEPLLFVGHTHTPVVYVLDAEGKILLLPPHDFHLEAGKRYLINVGSVGYPRERCGRCYSSYVIYDEVEQSVKYRLLPFSVASVMQRGTGERKRRGHWFGIGMGAAIGLSLLAFVVLHDDNTSPKVECVYPTSTNDTEQLLIACTNISTGSGSRWLKANLGVRGAAVVLKVTYRNAADETLPKEEMMVVKRSGGRKLVVPAEATVAKLEVLKLKAEDKPQLVSFNPIIIYKERKVKHAK